MSAITTSLQAIPSAAYNVDPAHSNVGFEVRHMSIATVRGRFGRFQGTLDATGESPVLEGTVDPKASRTRHASRSWWRLLSTTCSGEPCSCIGR